MFPLDLILLTNCIKWFARRMYFKFFAVKYSPVENILQGNISSFGVKDIYYSGTITKIRDNIAFVDGRFTFCTSQISKDVFVGDIVTCVINSTGSGLLSDLIVIDIINNCDEELKVSPISNSRTHGVVVKRVDRVFTVSPGPYDFNLDEVSTKFIPEVGDMIELHIKTEEDDNKVVKILPFGYKVICGTITSFENESGFINGCVIFQRHHCQPNYQPLKDDRVVLSTLRCQNGSTQFRALHVAPLFINQKGRITSDTLISSQNLNSDIVFCPTEVICVNLNETKTIDTELCNISNTEYKLIKLRAYSSESVIQLIEPSDVVLSLKPKSKAPFKFQVCLKYIGFCSITFDFVFEDFIFNCTLNLLAINKVNEFIVPQLELNKKTNSKSVMKLSPNPSKNCSGVESNSKPEFSSASLNANSDLPSKFSVPGRHFKTVVKFYPVKLGFFEVPNQLLNILKEGNQGQSIKKELEAFYPCLPFGLKSGNYKVYMHCLLYLEEICLLDKVSKLELTSGFERRDDFLILSIDEESYFTLLQPGDHVFARKPWDMEGDIYQGVIWQVQNRELFIKFDCKFQNNYVSRCEYILTFAISRTQLRMRHQAIEDTMHNLGTSWLFPNSIKFALPFLVKVDHESEECIIESKNSHKSNGRWNREGSGYGNRQHKVIMNSVIPVERKRLIKWFKVDLNAEQKYAVENCLGAECRPLPYVIFGPPGTGKSVTLIELCLQIYHLIPESKILLVAPSNSAADQLSLNLMGSGFVNELDFVRLGGYRYVKSGNIPEGLVKYVHLPVMSDEDSEVEDLPKISRLHLSEKRIIVSTLGSIGTLRTMGFPNGYFTHYVVDEAGQVLEPENLIIASLMSKDSHVVLAGDPLQLGPVVFSSLAKTYGLHHPFMLRLMNSKPYMYDKIGFPEYYGYNPKFITKLVRSYRALPKLLNLTSKLFYQNELKAMVNESSSREAGVYLKVRQIFPPDSGIPILFHSVSGQEVLQEGTFSFYNNEEVFQLCSYLSQLYRLGIEPHNIGIITPYVAQVRKINQFLNSLDQEIPKIGSVEEFQGQEKDVILLSTVRSSLTNDPSLTQLSFVCSPQRINVAISRAKAVLIIVGNCTTLSHDSLWRNIVEYISDHKSLRM